MDFADDYKHLGLALYFADLKYSIQRVNTNNNPVIP